MTGAAVAVMHSSGVAAASDGSTGSGFGEASYGEGGYGGSVDDTDESNPAVTTGEPTDVTATSATLRGDLTDTGGADETTCYFEWRESDADDWRTTASHHLESTGEFTETVANLDSDVEYEVRAVVETGSGADVGGVRSFRTDSEEGGDETTSGPTIDRFELVDRSNPQWARIQVEWAVSGETSLERCVSDLVRGGEPLDVETSAIDGTADSGKHTLRNRGGRGETYDVRFTVVDADGNTATETKRLTV
ncbi:hypothetical protein [Halomontanus rarus]|uniref:hypothetical protein n=1 Tax=Halomontanus rarus TaxID=3034020 RepID=UPI0023E81AE4|nr:hypothetical protein [Halovivax sp. TS33]